MLEGKAKINPKNMLHDIPYQERLWHNVKADVTYVTYHPLNWLNFHTATPRIAGIHAQTYWTKINPRYGFKPNLANIAHKIAGNFELKRFNAVHMVTTAYSIPHPNVYYIPNFVDSQTYKPTQNKDPNFTVAYTSRLVWQKGWGTFQAAIKQLTKHDKRIKTKVAASKIQEQDMPQFLSTAHVALLPSEVDTFGLAIVEALLCGTPVITTPLTTHKALQLPLIYANSTREFVEETQKLCNLWYNHKDASLKLTHHCRQQALKYDKTNIINKLENMLKEVHKNP
jgi:glycosyltransferase involved in cell wall biosynthesis